MISIFKQFLRQSRGSSKMTLPLKPSSIVKTPWTQTKLIGVHQSLYHNSSRGFLNFFKKDKKPEQNIPQVFRKHMEELLEKVKAEHQVELRECMIIHILKLFSTVQAIEKQNGQQQCSSHDILNEIEVIIDSHDDWIEENIYQIKQMLLDAYRVEKNWPKVSRYFEEFMDPHFLEVVFEKYSVQKKNMFALYLGYMMLDRDYQQQAIRFIKPFLEQQKEQNDDYPLSLSSRQALFTILIEAHIQLNQHQDVFQGIEEVIQIINSKDYYRDVSHLTPEEVHILFQFSLNMRNYCFSQQQYNRAFRLGDSLLAHLNTPDYNKEFVENLAYSVNILKNLDKHYKILLGLNIQLAKEQQHPEKKATGVAAEIEEKYLKSFEKFLGFQSEFIQHCNIKSRQIYSQPLIEDTLNRLSSEGKQALLKISRKYDSLSV